MTGCVWITGASSGIGAAVARRLADAGRRVVISARRGDLLDQLAQENGNLIAVPLDVTDLAAVRLAVAHIESEIGPIEIALLNAGTYWPTPAQQFDAVAARQMLDVNLLGAIHCLDAVLPPMLARRAGRLALVSSVAGYRGLPNAAVYSAGKAALIALAESLRLDLTGSGIALQVINPGFVETPLTAQNSFPMPDIISADEAAALIVAGLATDRFTISFPWRFALAMRLLRILPDRVYFPLVRRFTGQS